MKTIKNYGNTQIVVVDSENKKDEFATKQIMLDFFKNKFKENSFKKSKQTWYKDDGTLIYMFNVQNSQFGDDSFYFNISINFSEEGLRLGSSAWNVEARMLYGKSLEDTFGNIIKWFERFNSVDKIIAESQKTDKSETAPMFAIKAYLNRHNTNI